MTTSLLAVEAEPSKGAEGENFPVGSWLLPRTLRSHVATFYAFARAADDIADSPTLSADDKIERLTLFGQTIDHGSDDPRLSKAEAMRVSLKETGITPKHCHDLLSAFQQDAVKTRYETWDGLIDYCNRSAAPVGRYLLDLHGEDVKGYPASDALCNALQVLNHMQDCAADYRTLDRVYLPLDRLTKAGVRVEYLKGSAATPGLSMVLRQMAVETEQLVALARTLPGQLTSRSLAAESEAIVQVAARLTRRLKKQDPIARRVKLSRWEYGLCMVAGCRFWLFGR